VRPQVHRTSKVEVLAGMESASRNREELRPSDGRWRAPGGEWPVRRMTNSIRSVVVASLPLERRSPTDAERNPAWVGAVLPCEGAAAVRPRKQPDSALGRRWMVGDGMVGRFGTWSGETCRASGM